MANYTMRMPFRLAVRKEIFDSLSEDFDTTEESLQFLLKEFKDWKQYSAPKMNYQEAFKKFLMCLPSSFNAEWTHNGISEKLKSWFNAAGFEYKEQDTDKEATMYYYTIYRELPHVYKAHGMEWRP